MVLEAESVAPLEQMIDDDDEPKKTPKAEREAEEALDLDREAKEKEQHQRAMKRWESMTPEGSGLPKTSRAVPPSFRYACSSANNSMPLSV